MNRIIKTYGLVVCFALATISLFAQKQPSVDLNKSIQSGLELYGTYCQSCHMENGEGLEDIYPPLAKSDFLMADKIRSIKIILNGASGPMKVNGKNYEGEMPGYPLTDQEVSDLMNYIRNSFGNKGGAITPAEVSLARKK
jgi:nitrite reductase (NO-forming)